MLEPFAISSYRRIMHGLQGRQRRSDSTGEIPRRDTQKGCIMWLPAKTVDLGFDIGLHNHPVVILSLYADETVDFFLVRSILR